MQCRFFAGGFSPEIFPHRRCRFFSGKTQNSINAALKYNFSIKIDTFVNSFFSKWTSGYWPSSWSSPISVWPIKFDNFTSKNLRDQIFKKENLIFSHRVIILAIFLDKRFYFFLNVEEQRKARIFIRLEQAVLSRSATDIISVPTVEVSVELIFSNLNLILNKHHSVLSLSPLEDILFLRMNHKFSND